MCDLKIWIEPSAQELARIHQLYSPEKTHLRYIPIYEHFFILSSHWHIAEYDPRRKIMFGDAILDADYQNAEWG